MLKLLHNQEHALLKKLPDFGCDPNCNRKMFIAACFLCLQFYKGNSWIHAANDEIGVIKVFAEQTQTLDTVIQKIVRSLHTDIPKLSRTDDLIQKMSPLQVNTMIIFLVCVGVGWERVFNRNF